MIALALSACSQPASFNGTGDQISFGHHLDDNNPGAPGFADGLFGQRVTSSSDSGPMPRWQKVVLRFAQQRRSAGARCDDAGTCASEIWKRLVEDLKTLPLEARIEHVNDFINRIPYVAAQANWHDPAYWETPYEFFEHGGQCQDYAIAKYLALLESGVPEQELRFVVVYDAQMQLDHAITVVNVDGVPLVLDNQENSIRPAIGLQQRYTPYYALNDLGWSPYTSSKAPTVAWQAPARNTAAVFVSSFRVAKY
jgi:predicted transglutaminase-like cysteine proteinase